MNYTTNNTTADTGNVGIVSFDAAGEHAPALVPNQEGSQAFEILAKRYEPKLMSIAFVFTRDRRDAETIVQEALRKAFLDLRRFEGESSFLTWLMRIAVKEAFMSLRKSGAQRAPSLDF